MRGVPKNGNKNEKIANLGFSCTIGQEVQDRPRKALGGDILLAGFRVADGMQQLEQLEQVPLLHGLPIEGEAVTLLLRRSCAGFYESPILNHSLFDFREKQLEDGIL